MEHFLKYFSKLDLSIGNMFEGSSESVLSPLNSGQGHFRFLRKNKAVLSLMIRIQVVQSN